MNYGKEIDTLNMLRETAYNEYKGECERVKMEFDKAERLYRAELETINPERHLMREEMSKLYTFLCGFGDIGQKITPFDYKPEISMTFDLGNVQKHSDRGEKVVFNGADAFFTAMFPIVGPIIGISKKMKNKDTYLELNMKYEEEKTSYKNDIEKKEDYVRFVNDFAKIADIYRAIIAGVRDSIRDKVLPELEGVRSFIYADAVKNSIIDGREPDDVKLLSITSYQNSPYRKHYQFVKNAFAYYKLIESIFKEPHLTNLFNSYDNDSGKARREINKIKDKVKYQEEQLDENCVFNGE